MTHSDPIKRIAIADQSPMYIASLLARASGYSHDLGKYVRFFQRKLDSPTPVADPVRHEWMSLHVLQGLRDGLTWKTAWEQPLSLIDNSALTQPLITGRSAIDYLVATHHRLPTENDAGGCLNDSAYITDAECIRRPVAAPANVLLKDIQSLLSELDVLQNTSHYWRALASYTRVALIMADHSVSAIDKSDEPGHGNATKVHANTVRVKNARRKRNQSLEWHLRTVGDTAELFTQQLVDMQLPGLSNKTLATINAPATVSRFEWQNRAADLLRRSNGEPTLIFNMAGTGSGKTRANVKALTALNQEGRPCRIAVGLNLRTLTLQTRDAFKHELGMSDSELACIIGNKVAVRLHDVELDDDENRPEEEFTLAPSVTDTRTSLPEYLNPFLERSAHMEPLLKAPVAVCTTDYLIAAGEPDKQGHHAMAMLRLMHSDLILDEVDSYDPTSLIAVLRIVTVAAMWGRHVVVSSATLSPVVANAVYEAYECGIRMHSELFSKDPLWNYALIDNAITPELYRADSLKDFTSTYEAHVASLMLTLTRCYRPAGLQKVAHTTEEAWMEAAVSAVGRMHNRHAIDVQGIKVSVGLFRCANIKTAVKLSRHLSTTLPTARVCCYHSQLLAIQRFHIERSLDRLLNRKGAAEDWIMKLANLDGFAEAQRSQQKNLQFIVVATPVEEIGRDHDFDWAVIEPSSSQSIVQTAGRVNRHRLIEPDQPNIAIMQYPYKHCAQNGAIYKKRPTFSRPGLETSACLYPSHDLNELLNWSDIQQIDARVRFESHKLARLDDESMAQSLKSPLDRILGRGKYQASWMSKRTYSHWPLRESQQRETWRLDATGDYTTLEYIGHKQFKEVQQRCPGDRIVQVQPVANDWLVLTLSEHVQLSHSAGLSIPEGLAVSLPVRDNQVTHDLSFGFYC